MNRYFQRNAHRERTLGALVVAIPTASDTEHLDASKDEDISPWGEIGDEEMDLVTGERVDGKFGVGGNKQTMEIHLRRAQGRTASLNFSRATWPNHSS